MNGEVVFVITPIGAPGSDVRRRSDDLFDLVIEPVIDACDGDLVAVRGDKIDRPGSITEGIVEHILGSRVVIVDLAGANPNVYYEMGIADSFGIPTVRLSDDPGSLPFDAKDHNAITLVSAPGGSLFARDVETCRAALRTQLDHALAPGFTPTSIVVRHAKVAQIDALAASLDTGDQQDKALAAVLEKLSVIEARIDSLAPSGEPSDPERPPGLSSRDLYSRTPLRPLALLTVLADQAEAIPLPVWDRAAQVSADFASAARFLEARELITRTFGDDGISVRLTHPRSLVREALSDSRLSVSGTYAAEMRDALATGDGPTE